MEEMKTLYLSINNKAFETIKNGTKRVELRLNNEKRQKIKIDDIIIFHMFDDYSISFQVKVVGLSYYKNIIDLINNYKLEALFSQNVTANQ